MPKRRRDAAEPMSLGAVVFVADPPVVRTHGDIVEISVVTGGQHYTVAMTRRSLHVMTDQALSILTGAGAGVTSIKR